MTTSDNEWYSEWQRVTTSGTTSEKEWQWVTTSDKEWYNEWQRMTTSDSEWQRVTAIDTNSEKKWQQMVRASDSSGTTNAISTVHFKELLIAIFSMTKTDTLLFQGMDGCN